MRIFEQPSPLAPPREWERVSTHWRSGDQALLEMAIARQMPALASRVPDKDWGALLAVLDSLHASHPAAVLVVAEHLSILLQRLNVDGIRRWIVTGLRLHEVSGNAQLLAYFALDSRASVESLHAEGSAASLDTVLPSLSWLAHLLAGQAMAVQPREQAVLHAAPLRPVLNESHGLFLPSSYTALDAADHWNLLRAAVAHAAAHWRFSPRQQSGRGLKPMGHAVVGALEDARVECLLAKQFPGAGRWFRQAFAPPLRQDDRRGDFEGLIARLHWALADTGYEDDHGWIIKARSMFAALRERDELGSAQPLREAASILANDLGQMRLRMNLQAFYVPAAYRDDNSFLWDLGDSANDPPPELNATQEMQQQSARTTSREEESLSENKVQAGILPDLVPFFYPEWDYRLERLRPDWCTLFERPLSVLDNGALRSEALSLGARQSWRTAMQLNRQLRLRRQWQGDELDLDAAIAWSVDRKAMRDPSPRIFRDVGRSAPVLDLLVLVDLSESCNDLLDGSQLRLLDLQKQALAMLCERVDRRSTRLAIHGFHSNTRHSVSYFRLLESGQAMDVGFARALDGMQAKFSTRLGAALRHATGLLESEMSGNRAIVLVSDGVPSDVDVYDAQYLLEDARMAVHAARSKGVHVAALGIGAVDAMQMRKMFGQSNYVGVRNPLELPRRLMGLIARISR